MLFTGAEHGTKSIRHPRNHIWRCCCTSRGNYKICIYNQLGTVLLKHLFGCFGNDLNHQGGLISHLSQSSIRPLKVVFLLFKKEPMFPFSRWVIKRELLVPFFVIVCGMTRSWSEIEPRSCCTRSHYSTPRLMGSFPFNLTRNETAALCFLCWFGLLICAGYILIFNTLCIIKVLVMGILHR